MGRHSAPRPTRALRRHRPFLVVLLTLGLLAIATAAFAYWTAPGAGSGSARAGTLAAPTALTASAPSGSSTVSVSWTASAGTPAPQGYYVVRTDTATSATAAACGSSPTSLKTATSCSDASVPDGDYTYAVTAVYRSWTARSASSASLHVGVASRLAFTTQPSGGATSQTAFARQPVVTVQDSTGATVTGDSSTVTLALTTPGGATLACTGGTSKAASNGSATFAGCAIDKAGTYTLRATDGSLTAATSATVTVSPGAANKLVFTTQPGNGTGGSALATQPGVTVQDAYGNVVTSDTGAVTLELTTPGSATLTCTANPRNAVTGIATFSGCAVDKVGSYTFLATRSGITSATSSSFSITVGTAAKLAFTVQPSTPTASQTAFATQPSVTVQDAGGNTVTSSAAPVTLTITGSPAGVNLNNCTNNPKPAVSGVAAFATCRVNKAGTFTLTAAATGLAPATSSSFTIDGPKVTSVSLGGASGAAGNGTAAKDDTVTIQFSSALDAASVCATWSGTSGSLGGNNAVTVTIANTGTNDLLTVSTGTCTLNIGSIALGGDYVTATRTFGGSGPNASAISLDGTGKLIITLGKDSGTVAAGVPLGTPVYTPAATIADQSGNTVATTPFTGAVSRF